MAAIPLRDLHLFYAQQLDDNLVCWWSAPKKYAHLIRVRIDKVFGEWTSRSSFFLHRTVSHFVFCPAPRRTASAHRRVAVWAGICVYTGHLLSGVMTTITQYNTFQSVVAQECDKYEQRYLYTSRTGNCHRRVIYQFNVKSDSRTAARNTHEGGGGATTMQLGPSFESFRDEYVRRKARIIDCRISVLNIERQEAAAAEDPSPPAKKRRLPRRMLNFAPNRAHECLRPTLKGANKDSLNYILCVNKEPLKSAAATTKKKIPIRTDDDFYWSIITKWRGFDYDSLTLRPAAIQPAEGPSSSQNSPPQPPSMCADTSNVNENSGVLEETAVAAATASAVHTNLPQLQEIACTHQLNKEQLEFTTYIDASVAEMKKNTSKGGGGGVRIVALTGPAGSGKTKCLDWLRQHSILYVTCKGQLVQDINQSCHVDGAMTWAKLNITLTGLSFINWVMLGDALSQISPEAADAIFESEAFVSLPVSEKTEYLVSQFNVVYIDEFSMLSYGEVRFVVELLKKHNANIILVFVGDPAQIPPIRGQLGDDNAHHILTLAEREFQLKYAMRFTDNRHALLMDDIRTRILQGMTASKVATFIETKLYHKIALCPRFDIPLFYPEEPCPTLRLIAVDPSAPLVNDGKYHKSELPQQLVDFMVAQQNQKRVFTDFYIENALECLAWVDEYVPRINSFICYHMTNLNVHLGALAYSRALDELCGAPVVYSKIFTVVQTPQERSPFFGTYRSDRIQLLPLIVGHQYICMDLGAIVKRGSKLTLVHIEMNGSSSDDGGTKDADSDDKCKFLIMVDSYRVFYKISQKLYTLPLLCSNRNHYMSNYPPELENIMRNNVMYEVYGFPLMLANFSNIYQSQGVTIADQTVYLNLGGCSGPEMYVGLSRCRDEKQIQSIIIYEIVLF